MFDPRVRAHSREQGIIMAAFRFPRDREKEVDKMFDKSAEEMVLRDAYYMGDELLDLLGGDAQPDEGEDAYFPFDDDSLW